MYLFQNNGLYEVDQATHTVAALPIISLPMEVDQIRYDVDGNEIQVTEVGTIEVNGRFFEGAMEVKTTHDNIQIRYYSWQNYIEHVQTSDGSLNYTRLENPQFL